jgi:hypothetical protein
MQLSDLSMSSNNTNIFSKLSELSDMSQVENNQTGGFFNFFCDETKIEKAVLEAARLKKYDIVDFFVEKDLISSYDFQDENGNTLLHYLVLDRDSVKKTIINILKKSNVSSFINIQNNNGDTPLILAVIGGHHDLCEHLIARGADKTIKNKQNVNVETETDINSSIMAKPLAKNTSVFNKITKQNDKQIFNPIIEFLISNKQHNPNTSDAHSFTAMNNTDTQKRSSDVMDTESFIKEMLERVNKKNHTEDLIVKLQQNGGSKCQTCQMTGGGCGCTNNESNVKQQNDSYSETETLLHTLKSFMQEQDGGAKKKRKQNKNEHTTGKRAIAKFIDYAAETTEKRGDELSRIINNQTTEIIENIIKKIQEIITKHKKDFEKVSPEVAKGGESVARVYKSALWSLVKNDPKNPPKSSLDIAVEVQKIVSKDQLLKIDYNEWFNILKKNREEREKERESKKAKLQESSTISLSTYNSDYSSDSMSDSSMGFSTMANASESSD